VSREQKRSRNIIGLLSCPPVVLRNCDLSYTLEKLQQARRNLEQGRLPEAHAILDELIGRLEFIRSTRFSFRKEYAQRLLGEKQNESRD